ncbi:hypothetical protein [Streptomyces sp. NPDC050564]|uniref:hypothetical protein n=1 Tax=Streptomyces sp. NPDC050564 TaxID=3365631 RepID=UPI0037928CA7
MKAPLPDSTHATDDVVARIDPLWSSGEGAQGGRAAFADAGVLADDVIRQVEATLSGGVPDGV